MLGFFYYFEFTGESVQRKYLSPKQFDNVKQQYLFFRWQFKFATVLFQVGKYIEFYHQADYKIACLLGLQRMKANKRKALYGFPLSQLVPVTNKLVLMGVVCCFVGQEDGMCNRVISRCSKWVVG